MTRVIFWKELREQAAVVVALVALGAGLLAANIVLNPSGGGRGDDIGKFAVILLTMAAGVVIGATLFAGEREQKTFSYLDRLPATRRAVWPRKLLPGAVLTAAATLLLWTAGTLLGTLGDSKEVTLWVIVLTALAMMSFGWGTVGSTRGNTSIGSCGLALLAAAAVFLLALVVGLVAQVGLLLVMSQRELSMWVYDTFGVRRSDAAVPFPVVLSAVLGLFVMPYPISYRLFTRPDRDRATLLPEAAPARKHGAKPSRALRRVRPATISSRSRMFWLVTRQGWSSVAIVAAAPLLGLTLLIPEFVIPVALVAVGTLLGLLVAIAVWQDEQTSEAGRFWSERRIPAGRVWLWKSGSGLVYAAAIGLATAVPAVVAATIRSGGPYEPGSPPNGFGTGLFTPDYPFVTMLFLGPVTGFAFGQLAAMLFRKAVVASAVAVMVAGVFSAVWLPSMANGGLHAGLAFLPAVVALLTGRMLAWPWANSDLGSWRGVSRLVGGLTAATAVVAAGLSLRAFEVDPGPDPDADIVFAASLPTNDVEHAGRVLRGVAIRRTDGEALATARDAVLNGYDPFLHSQSLDALAQDVEWQEVLTKVAGMPVAVLEDPNEYFFDTPPRYLYATQALLDGHLALGLHAQAGGNPADFVRRFGEVLAAARLIRNKTFLQGHQASRMVEVRAYSALGHWLGQLGDEPKLLAMAQAHLTHHASAPYDTRHPVLASQTVARKSLNGPGQWLARYLSDPQGYLPPERRPDPSKRASAEAEFQALMWAFPWERERLRRVVATGNGKDPIYTRSEPVRGMSASTVLVTPGQADLSGRIEAVRTSVESRQQLALVALALRRYHADKGQFPQAIGDLVPRYLPATPLPLLTDYWYHMDLMGLLKNSRASPSGPAQSVAPFEYALSKRQTVIYTGPPDRPQTITTVEEVESLAAVAGGGVAFAMREGWADQRLPVFEAGDDAPETGGGGASYVGDSLPRLRTPVALSDLGLALNAPPSESIWLQPGDALVNYGVVRMVVPKPLAKVSPKGDDQPKP